MTRRTRRNLWALAGIAGLAVLLVVLASIPLLRSNAAGTDGDLVGRPAPAVEALDLATRGYVLEEGSIVGEDTSAALLNDERLRKAYLGL